MSKRILTKPFSPRACSRKCGNTWGEDKSFTRPLHVSAIRGPCDQVQARVGPWEGPGTVTPTA